MSDEIFFREVNEEIRQDRTRALWASYGKLLIATAVLAVILAGAYVAWREYQSSRANASGDRYLAAIELASAGNLDQSLSELEAISTDGYGAYRDLARMRVASVREAQGDPAAAVAAFDAIAADGAAPDAIRDMAAVRAAYVLVDTGSIDDVRLRVERLSGDAEPLRYTAREVLGLAEWKAGNLEEAKRFFDQLSSDQGTPAGIGLRTRVMLDLIASGTTPASAAANAAPAAASSTPAPVDAPASPFPASPAPPEAMPLPGEAVMPTLPLETAPAIEAPAAPVIPDAALPETTIPAAPDPGGQAPNPTPSSPGPATEAPSAPAAPAAPSTSNAPAN